jgi:hypothetical protein
MIAKKKLWNWLCLGCTLMIPSVTVVVKHKPASFVMSKRES